MLHAQSLRTLAQRAGPRLDQCRVDAEPGQTQRQRQPHRAGTDNGNRCVRHPPVASRPADREAARLVATRSGRVVPAVISLHSIVCHNHLP
ncbi:hypothetical protein GCM10011505_22450 [Tistrella bauzanensis]|uniref:Uncharacterized protein n=1 Tax=Tistrella bauzanensis TaxID=657419 RepID=A0ABQ1IIE7_9PROT|nr:hypothetical protein GCM10011505_22450 [Tistrella bauzanensis]